MFFWSDLFVLFYEQVFNVWKACWSAKGLQRMVCLSAFKRNGTCFDQTLKSIVILFGVGFVVKFFGISVLLLNALGSFGVALVCC